VTGVICPRRKEFSKVRELCVDPQKLTYLCRGTVLFLGVKILWKLRRKKIYPPPWGR